MFALVLLWAAVTMLPLNLLEGGPATVGRIDLPRGTTARGYISGSDLPLSSGTYAYFLRVIQTDGGRSGTSPVFVDHRTRAQASARGEEPTDKPSIGVYPTERLFFSLIGRRSALLVDPGPLGNPQVHQGTVAGP